MPLENPSPAYIAGLVVTNPANSDGLYQADDHLRLIKSALLNTFPNFTAAALSSTQAALDAAAVQNARNGAVPAGAVMDFAMATAPTGWLECNGASVLRATYPDLFTAIGTTWGSVDGTHFTLPGDRYRVGRTTAGAAVGTLQASQNKTHTHTGSGTTSNVSADHSHTYSGSSATASMNRSNPHSHPVSAPSGGSTTSGGSFAVSNALSSTNTGATDINHEHAFSWSGTTSGISANHTHTYSFTTSGGSADGTDARPLSAVYLTCIKT